MRFRLCLSAVQLAVALLASTPLLAQPPAAPEGGPWAADADGDGRITRDEMVAYMERRFSLMDQDSDGLVPVRAMQRMLGYEPQVRGQTESAQRGPGKGRGGPGGGPGGGGGPRGDIGGPPPGGRPPEGRRADAGSPPPGRAMPYPEDSNDDGQIDRAEFLAPALALFADRDRNGDGVLTADELPPPPPHGPPEEPED